MDEDLEDNARSADAVNRQRELHELHELDGGADALLVLQHRLSRSQAAKEAALQELRAVMSDSDALDNYGIDTTQV